MPHFSRLTDIVTCNLTALLEEADDPRQTLEEIIREMREGVAGAQRSTSTAARNLEKLEAEIAEQTTQIGFWLNKARDQLSRNDEPQARQALMRKKEVEALIAGLEQQRNAAAVTRDHLQTTLAALRSRLLDAERRSEGWPAESTSPPKKAERASAAATESGEWAEVDQELAALRAQIHSSDAPPAK